MTSAQLLIALVSLIAIYTLLLFVSYRPLTRPAGIRLSQSSMPIKTTTAEERSRGESSFIIRQERRFGITPKGFFLLAAFGYIALSVGFAIAFIIISRSAHA